MNSNKLEKPSLIAVLIWSGFQILNNIAYRIIWLNIPSDDSARGFLLVMGMWFLITLTSIPAIIASLLYFVFKVKTFGIFRSLLPLQITIITVVVCFAINSKETIAAIQTISGFIN